PTSSSNANPMMLVFIETHLLPCAFHLVNFTTQSKYQPCVTFPHGEKSAQYKEPTWFTRDDTSIHRVSNIAAWLFATSSFEHTEPIFFRPRLKLDFRLRSVSTANTRTEHEFSHATEGFFQILRSPEN